MTSVQQSVRTGKAVQVQHSIRQPLSAERVACEQELQGLKDLIQKVIAERDNLQLQNTRLQRAIDTQDTLWIGGKAMRTVRIEEEVLLKLKARGERVEQLEQENGKLQGYIEAVREENAELESLRQRYAELAEDYETLRKDNDWQVEQRLIAAKALQELQQQFDCLSSEYMITVQENNSLHRRAYAAQQHVMALLADDQL
ncbi:hypothetical protein [Ectobacillus ponti]|uniref:Uncharacterized protein n=1 Tax=Ectobacillus ponti TaxID=2961894 RepID=A0AA41XBC0_9BACI|nr:hypothetical protein [Ectobacillus ponti]MCP8970548.1 hypothetical protein [Ectobacillus ponti]